MTLTQNFYCCRDAGQIPEILPINHPDQYILLAASKYFEINAIVPKQFSLDVRFRISVCFPELR